MNCTDYSNEARCVLHGDQCVWGPKNADELDNVGCFDPCTDKTGRKACNRVPLDYCTWRPEVGPAGECWFRYKMTCSDYSNLNRCVGHGLSCDWVNNTCVELTEPSDSPDACNKYYSPNLCIRAPFGICAWDYSVPGASGNGACARKDTMPCYGNIVQRFCFDNPRCTWDYSTARCGDAQ